jgi:hypothetical protein
LSTLIIVVPTTHISWSMVVPSPTSMIVAMGGQVLGWMFGWVMFYFWLQGQYKACSLAFS